MSLRDEEITEVVIGAAIEVHRQLGPGLLESVYRSCLRHELELRECVALPEVPLDLTYKGLLIENGYRMDLVVEGRVVVEVKTVEAVTDLHEAQLLTYLKLSGHRTGLLLNFKTRRLKDGILRRVL